MNTPINLEELKTAWRAAKAAEDTANAERLAIEAAIVALMPSVEGSVTDAGVTVTFKVTRGRTPLRCKTTGTPCPNPSSRLSRGSPAWTPVTCAHWKATT